MLMPDYDNAFSFTSSKKNNAESVFEIQYMEVRPVIMVTRFTGFFPRRLRSAEIRTDHWYVEPASLFSGEQ